MGFRFQKRLKITPGITLNLSRKGVSTSVGATGARVTFGHGQRRTTIGLPGSGISHTNIDSTKDGTSEPSQPAVENDTVNLLIGIGFVAFLFFVAYLLA